MGSSSILLAQGETGKYFWSPALQQVYFVPKGKRREVWSKNLYGKTNHREGAYIACLKHAMACLKQALEVEWI